MRQLSRFVKIASFGLVAWFLLFPLMVHADTLDVTIQGLAFSPDSLLISPGTTVRWTNLDGFPHTVTSDDGLWDSGNLSTNDQYIRTFDSLGVFPYHCNIHPSMLAKVDVFAPPVPSLTPYGAALLVIFIIMGTVIVWRKKWIPATRKK